MDEFSPATRSPDGKVLRWAYECRSCAVERQLAIRTRKRTAEPDEWRRYLDQHNVAQRSWRHANPTAARAAVQRYRDKIKRDPARYARFLESRRIEHHLRTERTGTMSTKRQKTAKRSPEAKHPRLPSAPLAAFIDRIITARQAQAGYESASGSTRLMGLSEVDVCESLSVSARTLRGWRSGLYTTVQFDTAERVLLAAQADWEDVWPRSQYPEVYVGLLGDI